MCVYYGLQYPEVDDCFKGLAFVRLPEIYFVVPPMVYLNKPCLCHGL